MSLLLTGAQRKDRGTRISMMRYSTYTAEDFACDDDFLKWVKHGARYPETQAFWENWLLENPQKKEVVEEARNMILAVVGEKQYMPDREKEKEVWKKINESLRLRERKGARHLYRWPANVAAVILLAVMVGWFYWAMGPSEIAAPAVEASESLYVSEANDGQLPRTILLGDGTSVVLDPGGVLKYPRSFKPDVREVFLTGQAFFEVAHDASRPFLVQAGEIITRVLGTSFTVRNYEGESSVLVQVKSGKVSVFRTDEKKNSLAGGEQVVDGVVLMPNQQVLYEREGRTMTKSLVQNPAMLLPLETKAFEFVDTPVKDVFAAIEAAYGVDVVFDEQALSTCYLNASLGDVTLYEKLRLICKGIDATYQVIDSHIIIYGRGCSPENQNPNPD